jgi:hypothetical protein
MAVTIAPRSDAALRREEKRYHPRVTRALVVLAKRLKKLIPRDELERALASGNVNKVMELYAKTRIKKQAAPLAAILRDVAVRMGRATAREI